MKGIDLMSKSSEKANKLEFGFETRDDRIVITRLRGDSKELKVPDEYQGLPVAAIAPKAFAGLRELEKVTLPDSLEEVGAQAFADCVNLRTVTLGAGVQVLRSGCFERCGSLADIEMPNTLGQIMRAVFRGCTALVDIALPEALEVLNRETFSGCSALESVNVPVGLKRIGTEAFKDCASLEEVFFYSQRGISDVRVTDTTLRETTLPTFIEYIGPGAFAGCSSLPSIDIPYGVRKVNASSFQGCTDLQRVTFHNLIKEIGPAAFAGCPNIASVRIPFGCNTIAPEAFDKGTEIVSTPAAPAKAFAKQNGYKWRAIELAEVAGSSAMVPRAEGEPHQSFYSSRELSQAVERFELRQPSYSAVDRRENGQDDRFVPSRFTLENGVYQGKSKDPDSARLMMVGDLMAGYFLQAPAYRDGKYSFDWNFAQIRDLLQQSDVAIANMETMISPSAPYTRETQYVDTRAHLNAPESYLQAVRNAGFDCVIGAQNHAYDTGVTGIIETLDRLNKHQLMHTGLFASKNDKRYILLDVGGIRIAIVSYLDGARQRAKKANFTKVGVDTLISLFDQEQVRSDIEAAREDGAEFVLAYCHWGREYTVKITEKQRKFAQWVVDAGADYIMGAHSHCLQPYEVLTRADGKAVPCLWSAGNFMSSGLIRKPHTTRDTVVMDVVLRRNEYGTVEIDSEYYQPCRILSVKDEGVRNYTVVPTDVVKGPEVNPELAEANSRIAKVLGAQIARAGEESKTRENRSKLSESANLGQDSSTESGLEKYEIAQRHLASIGMPKPSWTNILIAAEALNRGITVEKEAGKRGLLLSFDGATHRWVGGGVSSLNTPLARSVAKYKDVASSLFRGRGVGAPENAVFEPDDAKRAWAWSAPLQPLVLKPQSGEKGGGVHVGVRGRREFNRAFNEVSKDGARVLVEQFCGGVEHRCVVVDGKLISVVRRRPASVLGDGEHSVEELIKLKNKDRKGNNPKAPAHKLLKLGAEELRTLRKQKLKRESVPARGQRVYLRETSNLATGGDAIDATSEVSAGERKFIEKAAAAIPDLRFAGLDVLLPRDGNGEAPVVIEINHAPGIRGPHFPWEGQSRDVAGAILDAMFPTTKDATPKSVPES